MASNVVANFPISGNNLSQYSAAVPQVYQGAGNGLQGAPLPNQYGPSINSAMYGPPTPSQSMMNVPQIDLNHAQFGPPAAAQSPVHTLNAAPSSPMAAPNPAQGTSSTAGKNPYMVPFQTFLGHTYDFNNANERLKYFGDNNQYLNDQYNQAVKQINTQYQSQLTSAGTQNRTAYGQIGQDALDYANGYDTQKAQAANAYGTGLANIQQGYSQMSPQAAQSSQAYDTNYAANNYARDQQSLDRGLQENVGQNFLTAYHHNPQMDVGTADTSLDQNSKYGRDFANQNQQYNQYLTDQKNGVGYAQQQALQQKNQGLDAAQTNLQRFDYFNNGNANAYSQNLKDIQNTQAGIQQTTAQSMASGYNPSQVGAYAAGNYQPTALPSVNLNNYSPVASVGQAQQGATGFFAPPPGMANQDPKSSFLGYNPNALNPSSGNVTSYLQGPVNSDTTALKNSR